MNDRGMPSIAVLGAGVIGQALGARLAEAGVDVTMIARGRTLDHLRERGIRAVRGESGAPSDVPIDVVDAADEWPDADLLIVAVRRDQVLELLPAIAAWRGTGTVVYFGNMAAIVDRLIASSGDHPVAFAFPGLIGRRDADGTVRYDEVAEQAMTVGADQPDHAALRTAFERAGFRVDVVPDMVAWLRTHLVFIAQIGIAAARAGGAVALARRPGGVAALTRGIGDGLRALESTGTALSPALIRTVFARMPRVVARMWFAAALRGRFGRQLDWHVTSAGADELPVLADDIRSLLGDRMPASTRRVVDLAG